MSWLKLAQAYDFQVRPGFVGVSGVVPVGPPTRSQLLLPDPNLTTLTYCAQQRALRNAELARLRALLLGTHARLGKSYGVRKLSVELLQHVGSFLVPPVRDYCQDVLADVAHGRYRLPVHVHCELQAVHRQECFLVATDNKLPWGAGGDGLTIYGGNEGHFMRSRVFGGMLDHAEQNPVHSAALTPGWHRFDWLLYRDRTVYAIDGKIISFSGCRSSCPRTPRFWGCATMTAPCRFGISASGRPRSRTFRKWIHPGRPEQ
eukprot:g20979.t1